ncbi:MAG: DNA-3-methyladenine glycosylase [Candidatus Aminicenantales bacterium]
MRIIRRAFYARPTSAVARDLLGRVLVRRTKGRILTGRIVETEAYASGDPASHAFRGRTERNRALFGEVGHAYIYQTRGQYCLNVVAKKAKPAGGILIRALEPLEGIDLMRRSRKRSGLRRIASGPGNLSRAMRIDLRLYGADLTKEGPLFITDDGAASPNVRRTVRIGVTAARDKRWRFVVEGSPFITRPRLQCRCEP